MQAREALGHTDHARPIHAAMQALSWPRDALAGSRRRVLNDAQAIGARRRLRIIWRQERVL